MLILLGLLSCSSEPEVLKSHSFVASGAGSVFEQSRERFRVEYDSLALGMFITGIEGKSQSRTSFWLYAVNGEPINVSSDKCFPEPGDTVEWRLTSVY